MLKIVDAASDDQVVFGLNGTDCLNLAIQGTLRPGDHLITSVAEHNSVLRPIHWLEQQGQLSVTRLETDSLGRVTPQQVQAALRAETRLVSLVHCSNVTGARNDIQGIGNVVSETDAMFLVDAAQSVGTMPVSFLAAQADLMAFPGHKGLFGPLGTGCLVVGKKALDQIKPIRQGGTGVSSDSDQHPTDFPDGFEAGNLNLPGLMGLLAGSEYLLVQGIQTIADKKAKLTAGFLSKLQNLPQIRIVSDTEFHQSGIVSFVAQDFSPNEFAAILDSSFQIQVRAGHHCAAQIHERIGCPDGCVRVSIGHFTTATEIEKTVLTIQAIVS